MTWPAAHITRRPTTRFAYHSDEDTKLRTQFNLIAIGKNKTFLLFLFCSKNDSNLLSGHRQDGKFDSVELVETTPRPGLCEA